jgi:hypothetical protein
MKSLKFHAKLVAKILSGETTITWRLFDDKDLTVGDELEFVNAESGEVFGSATITHIDEKPLHATTAAERLAGGWKPSVTIDQIVAHYQKLYRPEVTVETSVKMISFKLTVLAPPKSQAVMPHYREFEKKPLNRGTTGQARPTRPNHMAYRAVSRPAPPGGGK